MPVLTLDAATPTVLTSPAETVHVIGETAYGAGDYGAGVYGGTGTGGQMDAESSDALTLGIGLFPDAANAYPDHTDAYPSALELSGELGASAASSSVLTLVAA